MQLKADKHYVERLCKAILKDVEGIQEDQMEDLIYKEMSGWFPAKTREVAIERITSDRYFVPTLEGAKIKAEQKLQAIEFADRSGMKLHYVKLEDYEAQWLLKWANELSFEKPLFPPDSPGEGDGGDGGPGPGEGSGGDGP